MKIAIFTDTFLPQVNGVTNTLKRFGDYLKAMDIDYIFITPDQKCSEKLSYNVEEFFSTPFLFYQECRLTLTNKLRLNRRLDLFKPDIIFLMTEFNVGFSGLNYGKKNNIPVISNYSTNFNTIIKSYKLGILEKVLNKYISWFHNEADYTVTPSKESKQVLHELGVRNVGIFGRGIDYQQFSPLKSSYRLRRLYGIEDKILLLYVGRLSAEKDLDILSESMHLLNKKYEDNIALMITGEGPMESELRKTMPDNVIFTGYKKGNELAEIYATADIFTFPSSFETFGNVVLESLASGVPVVGVNQGGVVTLIKHGENGYLANPKDSVSFASYIEKLITNEVGRYQFGQKGRLYAKEKSWDAEFDNLIETFSCVINDVQANRMEETA